jgi:hypothetical protein
MYAQKGQDSTSAPRWLAGRPRVTGAVLAAVGWAATFAADVVGSH